MAEVVATLGGWEIVDKAADVAPQTFAGAFTGLSKEVLELGEGHIDRVDTLLSGRRIRILAVVNDFTRECLALVVDTSPSGLRVAASSTLLSPPEVGR